MTTLLHVTPNYTRTAIAVPLTFYSVRFRRGSGAYVPLSDEDTPMQPLAFIWLRNLATEFKKAGYAVELNERGWFFATKDGERTVSAVVWEEAE